VGDSSALLREAYRGGAGRARMEEIARRIVAHLRGGAVPAGTPDPRVLRAMRMLSERADDPPAFLIRPG
jgi:hypothetical protein